MLLSMGQLRGRSGLGQTAQDNWWAWFMTGQQGPPPAKPAAAQAPAFDFSKSAAFDQYTVTPDAAWGGEDYEGTNDEDIDPMAAQGSQDQALTGLRGLRGLSDNPVTAIAQSLPAPVTTTAVAPAPAADSAPRRRHHGRHQSMTYIAGALALGGLAALTLCSSQQPSRRSNPSKRKN